MIHEFITPAIGSEALLRSRPVGKPCLVGREFET